MPAYHLKEITYHTGTRDLIWGPGQAQDIRNPRKRADTKRLRSLRSAHTIMACLGQNIKGYKILDFWVIQWGRVSSITNVPKQNLPLYISWDWKSEQFETLLKGV